LSAPEPQLPASVVESGEETSADVWEPLSRGRAEKLSRLILPALAACVAVAAAACLVALILVAYSVPGLGFGGGYSAEGWSAPARNLWDWLQLLVVPLALSGASLLVTVSLAQSVARDRRDEHRERALVRCVNLVTELLVKPQFQDGEPDPDEGRRNKQLHLVQAQVLATLRILDGARKGRLVYFLHASRLLGDGPGNSPRNLPAITLPFADLRGVELPGERLDGIWLETANLQRARLERAHLRGAQMDHADLRYAHLTDADLGRACFNRGNLEHADLRRAKTRETEFGDVRLRGTRMSRELKDMLSTQRSGESEAVAAAIDPEPEDSGEPM
jgi:hypothetical protein